MHRVTSVAGYERTWDDGELREIGPELSHSPAQLANMTIESKAYVEDDAGFSALNSNQRYKVRSKNAVFVRCVSLLELSETQSSCRAELSA